MNDSVLVNNNNNSNNDTNTIVTTNLIISKTCNNNNNSNNFLNSISKPLFDSIVNEMDFKTFFKFGSSICKKLRSYFFYSKRWRIVDLSFMSSDSVQDKTIYRLCSILNQYYYNNNFKFIDRKKDNDNVDEDNDNNQDNEDNEVVLLLFHSFYIDTLILDKLFKITSNVFKYINNCIIMSKIENLSLINCLGIKFMNSFFEIEQPRNIQSLSLPSLSIEPSNYFKKLSTLTSLSVPGTIESIQLYKYLESCPLLTKLELNLRSKDSLFNPSLLEKLYKCKQITHLTLLNMIIRNDIFISLFMSLTNLQVIVIRNNFQINGSAINVALESIPNLKELSIDYCRNVKDIKTPSTNLKLFHSSYTLTCPEIDFPNLIDLSITDWIITKDNCFSIFSKFNNLKYLDIGKTKIDDEIFEIVLSLVGENIEVLDLDSNIILTNLSIDLILKYCKKLCKIYLNNTNISKEKSNELLKIKSCYLIKT